MLNSTSSEAIKFHQLQSRTLIEQSRKVIEQSRQALEKSRAVAVAAAALVGGGDDKWSGDEPQSSPEGPPPSLPPGPPDDSPPFGPAGSDGTAASVASLPAHEGPPGAGEELVDLADLADLAELPDEVAVAALHRALSSESMVSAPDWAQSDVGSAPSMPAFALSPNPEAALMSVAWAPVQQPGIFFMHNPSAQPGQAAFEMVLAAQQSIPGSACATAISQATHVIAEAQRNVPQHMPQHMPQHVPQHVPQHAPTSLKEIFAVHVMCDYTPRDPKSLPTSRWATLGELVSKLQQHAPMEVLKLGHQNLRQMITEWYKLDPAFAGLAYSAWGKRLKDNTPDAHARSLLFKFCLEHTPAAKGKT